ncbi:putative penguin [Danaus plexippus plexippus]|uniref:Penguin n=1 Tax=Danaus plexippus plexippus TaxID=278856 RepID=A0A212EP73_DANPL|nr:putative penguin [Danaus plexippus plexippus]
MQKLKRKNGDDNTSPLKKKKVQFSEPTKDGKGKNNENNKPFKKGDLKNKEINKPFKKGDLKNNENNKPFKKGDLKNNENNKPFKKGDLKNNENNKPFKKGDLKNNENNKPFKKGDLKNNENNKPFKKGDLKNNENNKPFKKGDLKNNENNKPFKKGDLKNNENNKPFKKGDLKNKEINKPFKKGDLKNNENNKPFKKGDLKNGKKFSKPGFKGKAGCTKNTKLSSKDGKDEKPKWSEMKKEKKNLRLERRKAKSTAEIFEISNKAKLLAAQIQRKVIKPDFRSSACKELHALIKGQYKAIALTHDLSRVIQVLLKHSSDEIKHEITEELMDIMATMMQSKYAHHSVKRILKYGTDAIRHQVIKKLLGNIVSLASHSISAPVLDYAYGEFASKKEKMHMQQEFYGEMYKNTKDDRVKTLSDTYKDSPEMKAAILQSCKANIQRILDKNLHDSELLHSVLYDYIRECSKEDQTELISSLSPLIVPLSNSLPGTILKVVKEHVVPLSKHKTGYRLLIVIFDSVDDTVLVKKAIVSTLVSNLKDIARDHWGKMTLHWLVKPKDSAAFHPTFIKFLEEGLKTGTSKKDTEIRVSELRELILPAIKSDIENDPEFWLKDKATLLLTIAVLSIDHSKKALEELAKVICKVDWTITNNDNSILAIEDAGMHMCLKKLAALDKDAEESLGNVICDNIEDETLKMWLATNRGCFFIVKLIENNGESTSKKWIKKLKPHSKLLKAQSSEGAKILLQSL